MPTTTPLINDPAERKQRHLAQSQEIQRLAMGLIRQTAAKAEQHLDQPNPEPDPETPSARTPDHVLQFVRLARVVNHAMAVETRIANDDLTRRPNPYRPATPRPQPPPDARRPLLRQALHRATQTMPDRARRRRELDDHLDAELAADPDQIRHPTELLVTIAQAAEIPIDPKDVRDELLDYQPADLTQTETQTPNRPLARLNL